MPITREKIPHSLPLWLGTSKQKVLVPQCDPPEPSAPFPEELLFRTLDRRHFGGLDPSRHV